ncbi:hypothetical protein BCA37_10780 [Mycobacterium sp. djl-10]|nr:hypothetical protein BCA37_10780 [Mycobacterium sp. djl-10]
MAPRITSTPDTTETTTGQAADTTQAAVIESPAAAQAVPSDPEKAAAEAAASAAEDAHPLKGKFVQYNGQRAHGVEVTLTPQNWADSGVESTRTHVWDVGNDWQVPATQFTDAQIDHLLQLSRRYNRFKLVDAQGAETSR